MGLHRADSLIKFDQIERETRKRIFWSLRAMDAYITTILDLPRAINDEDTDQEMPLEVDDALVTPHRIKGSGKSSICSMTTVNAHIKLSLIMAKVKKSVLGTSNVESKRSGRYLVDYASILQAEGDLAEWYSSLPDYSKLQSPVPRDVEK